MVGPARSSPEGPSARRAYLRSLLDDEFAGGDDTELLLRAICRVAVRALGLSGAAISLMTADRFDGVRSSTVAVASTEQARAIEELEFSTGEGPGTAAFLRARPVLTPDLDRASGRWPAYAPAARAAGAVASFAFPMHVGAVRLGIFHLHCSRPRSLSADEVATCLDLTAMATTAVLDAATSLDGRELDQALMGGPGSRDQIYQAQGMTSVELDISLTEALARMRAHAFGSGRDLAQLAAQLLAGTTQLPRFPDEQQ